MKPIEMVEMIKKSTPELIGKVPDQRAAAVIRASFAILKNKLDTIDEGVVKLPGFGNFFVRQVVRKKGDEESTVKRIVFRSAKKTD
jgi:nucleoid DNA-binding protein